MISNILKIQNHLQSIKECFVLICISLVIHIYDADIRNKTIIKYQYQSGLSKLWKGNSWWLHYAKRS